MARTPSVMIPLGSTLPIFGLHDVISGITVTEELLADKIALIMFICNHCPYVKHVNTELVRLANDYMQNAVRIIAINSNDAASYPEDSPENMKEAAKQLHYP